MSKLSNLEKEYIKANYKNKSIDEFVRKFEKDRELIEEYVNNLNNNKKNNKREKKSYNNREGRKNKGCGGKYGVYL